MTDPTTTALIRAALALVDAEYTREFADRLAELDDLAAAYRAAHPENVDGQGN